MSFIPTGISQGSLVIDPDSQRKQLATIDSGAHDLLFNLVLQVAQLNKNLSGSSQVEDETQLNLKVV